MKKPLALFILDGYAISENEYGNAIRAADTPFLDELFATCSHTTLGASGMDVGLPDGQMGNSEVGHTNIGAGRVVYQELTRITKSIRDGAFFRNEVLLGAIENCKRNHSKLHLIGLVSDGGVHSHTEHLYALLKLAKNNDLKNVFVHAFLDGRDVPPTSGRGFLSELSGKMEEIGVGKLSSVMGRYYAMDRDTRWERVEKAYAAMVYHSEENLSSDAVQSVEQSYENGVTDEFVVPFPVEGGEKIAANDSVIFFNFRPDRARELTRAFVDDSFDGFERKTGRLPLYFICMTQYDITMPNVKVAFEPSPLTMTMGEYLSKNGLTQLRIAETTKYAHVTFFYNGGEEVMFEGEDRVLIPTPNVATFDLKPEMSAYEVADAAVERIKSGKYDVIILNFANCDMVGHTGIFEAAVAAVEAVDACVARVVTAVREMDGISLITADHGNADQMWEPDGSPFTAHTTNRVPFLVVGKEVHLRDDGILADIAPTMLDILKLPKPREMDGASLIL